jgi:hypothetical protein
MLPARDHAKDAPVTISREEEVDATSARYFTKRTHGISGSGPIRASKRHGCSTTASQFHDDTLYLVNDDALI